MPISPNLQHVSPRFQGYSLGVGADGTYNNQVQFYKQGLDNAQSVSALIQNHDGSVSEQALQHVHTRSGTPVWRMSDWVPLSPDMHYSFKVVDHDGQEFAITDLTEMDASMRHNVIDAKATQRAHKSGPIADIFQNSLVTKQRARALEAESDPFKAFRNPINQFVSADAQSTQGDRTVDALNEILPQLDEQGFRSVLLKPYIGGDFTAHGYWTTDLYALNKTFHTKQNYRKFLGDLMSRDMKLYSDGAFVNQSMMGLQFMSNLLYGKQSPYWDWFRFQQEPPKTGLFNLPELAVYKKMAIGIVPERVDNETGRKVAALDHVAFRIINPQPASGEWKRQPYLELFDPTSKIQTVA